MEIYNLIKKTLKRRGTELKNTKLKKYYTTEDTTEPNINEGGPFLMDTTFPPHRLFLVRCACIGLNNKAVSVPDFLSQTTPPCHNS